MQRITKTTLTLLGFLGLSAFGQEAAMPQPPNNQNTPAVSREAKMARREAMQKLGTDFSAAIKNGSLSADDLQKAQSALAALQPHGKNSGAKDPQARHDAMKTLKQLSANPALRPEDRDLLAQDLAALRPVKQ